MICVFVDTGFMRKNERELIESLFKKNFDIKLKVINASQIFLISFAQKIQRKRKIIGREFIKIFERFALKQIDIKYLAQGTLYPDVIESISKVGKSFVTIKSHHNVGGLPKDEIKTFRTSERVI